MRSIIQNTQHRINLFITDYWLITVIAQCICYYLHRSAFFPYNSKFFGRENMVVEFAGSWWDRSPNVFFNSAWCGVGYQSVAAGCEHIITTEQCYLHKCPYWLRPALIIGLACVKVHIEGILPKGPYRMAGRALLAGYHRYRRSLQIFVMVYILLKCWFLHFWCYNIMKLCFPVLNTWAGLVPCSGFS